MKEPTKKASKAKPSVAKPVPLVEEVEVVETPEEVNNSVKHILSSKTIWVNLLSIVALILQKRYGFVIDESLQIEILGFINIALRMLTKEPVSWSK